MKPQNKPLLQICTFTFSVFLLLSAACSLPFTTDRPAPTPTNAFPVEVIGCMEPHNCPGVTLVSRVYGDKVLEYNVEYPATIPPQTQVWMSYLWCSIDQATLDDNLKRMAFDLTVDGVSYVDSLETEYFTVPTAEDLNVKEYCYGVGGAIRGWQAGHTYRVVFGPVFTSDLFDGWKTYAAGSQQEIYLLTINANAAPVGN
jgi:hypothetical protein